MKAVAILFSIVLFVFAALASVEAVSHPSRDGFGGEGGPGRGNIVKMLERLDLTDAQKQDVAGILKKYREEIGNLVTGMSEAHSALKTAVTADEYSESAVRQAAHQVAEQGEQLAVLHAQILNEIKSVLTPEQKERFRKIGEKRAEKMKGFVDSRLSALDKWIAEHGE